MNINKSQAVEIAKEYAKNDFGETLPMKSVHYVSSSKADEAGYVFEHPARWAISFELKVPKGFDLDYTVFVDPITGEPETLSTM